MTQPLRLDTWRALVAERPIAVIDTETTDADAAECGVCEIGIASYDAATVEAAIAAIIADAEAGPPASLQMPEPSLYHTQRCNPGRPIHPAATAVHGIVDADVANEPGIESLADILRGVAQTHTVVTFNGRRFDLPILRRLVGLECPGAIDVMGLWRDALVTPVDWWSPEERGGPHVPEPRLIGNDLLRSGGVGSGSTGAAKVYRESLEGSHFGLLGYPMGGAHQALADVRGTARVLFAILALWGTDGGAPAALAARADLALASVRETPDGPMMAVGKFTGVLVRDVMRVDPSYLGWVLAISDFEADDKARVTAAIGHDAAAELVAAQNRRGGGRRSKPRA